MSSQRTRLVVLVSHPIQYYAPLFRELAARGHIDLHVVYLSDAGAVAHMDEGFQQSVSWDIPLLEGYAHAVLQSGKDITRCGFWQRHDARLTGVLRRFSPQWVLLYGYAGRMNWVALWWAKRHGVKVAYTSDSNINAPARRWRDLLKRVVVGTFFRGVDAFLSTSESNLTYLDRFGATSKRVYRLPFAIDVERFAENALPPGYKRPIDFVWAGKFIKRKRPQDFVHALALLASVLQRPVRACMVGDGPMRAEVEAMARNLPLGCKLEFTGFVNQQGMPSVLHQAAVFAFTSENEPYGLAATEAAAAGLALIVAEGIGCIGDTVLARPGINTLVYKAGDVDSLAGAMVRLITHPEELARMQGASMEIAATHDLACAAAVIEMAVTGVTPSDVSLSEGCSQG